MEKVKLTSICRPKQWKTIPTSELGDVGYPVYGANGVIGYYDNYNHEQETVIITCRGATCGTVNLTHPRSYVTGNAMCLDDVKDSVDIKYLFYSMQAYDFTKVISGTAQPQITRVGLEKVEFALPSLDMQRKIVSILDKTDSLIEKRRLQLEKLDDLIKARFVEMFGEDIKQSNMTIADIAEETTVGIANSATHAYSESGVVMLRNQNIRVNYLDDRDLIYIKQDFAEKYKNKALHEGDILVTRTGANVGMACIVPKKYEGCQTFTTLILRLRKDISISPIFVCHYINSPLGKSFVDENKIGGGQPNFGAKQLSIMPIVVPSEEKQIAFDLFVNQVDKSKYNYSSSSLFLGI